MIIDLSEAEVFDSNELELDKKITFIYGKNGTGKSTMTDKLKGMSDKYDVSAFQGFTEIIDENKRLNAVVLGEENTVISRQIEVKRAEIEIKHADIKAIKVNLEKPEDDSISNYWTRRENAEKEYAAAQKRIKDFCTQAASKIKAKANPRVAKILYDRRDFISDIGDALLLSDEELNQFVETIKSEVKEAPLIMFPTIDFEKLRINANSIIEKVVTERIKIARLDNNPEKRNFAEIGHNIHKMGEVCAFCGNRIDDNTWNELDSYFSADEVKDFQNEIKAAIEKIDLYIENISSLEVNKGNFYPAYVNEAAELEKKLETKKKEMYAFLKVLRESLDEKMKYLFETQTGIGELYIDSFEKISEDYENLRKRNNENDLIEKQSEAADKIRKHYVKELLDEFGYDAAQAELKILEIAKKSRIEEYNKEEEKISGASGLLEKIKLIQEEIISLQKDTKNEKN